jgi:hypothetical protein
VLTRMLLWCLHALMQASPQACQVNMPALLLARYMLLEQNLLWT